MFQYRDGVRLGGSVGVGAFWFYPLGNLRFVLNVGIVPAIDFRTGLDVSAGGWKENGMLFIGAPATFELNMGSIFSMMIGGELGFYAVERPGDCYEEGYNSMPCPSYVDKGFWGGPTASIAKFRFGDKRQFELGEISTGVFGIGEQLLGMKNELVFTGLFMPAKD